MEASQVSIPERDPFFGFPEEVQEDVKGLAWLGYLEDEFTFGAHHFQIRTLYGDEDLMTGPLTKKYVETQTQAKASVWAHVCLCTIAIDHDDTFCVPAIRDEEAHAHARFRWFTKNMFWPTALALYNRYTGLLERQADALQAVEDLSQRGLHIPPPSADSLTDREFSTAVEPEETALDYLGD